MNLNHHLTQVGIFVLGFFIASVVLVAFMFPMYVSLDSDTIKKLDVLSITDNKTREQYIVNMVDKEFDELPKEIIECDL